MAAAVAALLIAGAARADIVSEAPDTTSVTIYHTGTVDTSDLMRNGNYGASVAFIVETRTIELPAGPSVIRFRGVASTMVPQSADVKGLPGGVQSEDYDYDLLSPGSLLAKSVGKHVHLIRTDPKTGRESDRDVIVRAASGGAVLESGGGFEALHCGGPAERLVFDTIPDGLTDKPTLSVRTAVPMAGRYKITLNYLATGMNWSADYVARLNDDGETLDLTGWITLANFSDTSFADAPTHVIAGDVGTGMDDEPIDAEPLAVSSACWPLSVDWTTRPPVAVEQQELVTVTASRMAQIGVYSSSPVTAVTQMEELGDYKLYTLPQPTTVAARQTKQVLFLDRHGVKYSQVYRATIMIAPDGAASQPATIRYRLQNSEDAGLGQPLPAGKIALMAQDAGGLPLFVGRKEIEDTPEGLPVTIDTGVASAVRVTKHVVADEIAGRGNSRRERQTLEIEIANGKPIPIRFELSQYMQIRGTRISAEDRPHEMDRGDATWCLTLGAGEHAVVRYTVDYPK